jgi:hypothetical protein
VVTGLCRSKHVEPSINIGIIISITKLHLVRISTESSTLHGSMSIKLGIDIFIGKGCLKEWGGHVGKEDSKGKK